MPRVHLLDSGFAKYFEIKVLLLFKHHSRSPLDIEVMRATMSTLIVWVVVVVYSYYTLVYYVTARLSWRLWLFRQLDTTPEIWPRTVK